MAETVRIKVIIDAKDAKKGSKQTKEYLLDIGEAADKTEKQTKQMGLGTVTAGNLMAMAYAEVAQRALETLKRTRDLAFTVEETGSKYKRVLGKNVDEANGFLEENARLMGVTNTEGKEYISTAVAIARGLKMQEDAATEFGLEWTKLAADFQSFFNVPFEEAFGAIRSGLVGEQEPLKRFGVLLTEAETQQRALVMTGKENASQLTDQEKVLARYNLIVEKSGQAVGDLEATQNSGANVSRRASAEYRQLAENIAQRMIPAFGAGARIALSLAENLNELIEVPLIEQLKEQQNAYNELHLLATSVNTSQSERIRLIRTMKQEYPQFLEGINEETVSNERLNEILKEVNKSYQERIDIQEILSPVAKSYASVQNETAHRDEIRKQLLLELGALYRNNKDQVKALVGELDIQNMSVKQVQETLRGLNYAMQNNVTYEQALAAIRKNSRPLLSDWTGLLQIAENMTSRHNDRLEEARNQLQDLGFSQERINELLSKYTVESGDAADSTKSLNDLFNWSLAVINGGLIPNMDALTSSTSDLSKQEKKLKEQLDEILSIEGTLTRAHLNEAAAIQTKIDNIEKERKAREYLLGLEQYFDRGQAGGVGRSGRQVGGATIGSEVPGQSFSTTDSDSKSLNQLQGEREELEKQFTETANREERKRLLTRLQANQEEIRAAEQGITRKELLRQEAHQRAIEQFQFYVQTVAQGYNQIVQIQSQATQNRIQKIQQEKEAALGAIDAKLQNDRLSEKQRQNLISQREKAEEKYQEKIDELQHKQFERERKAKLAEIAMNAAVAVSKVWGQTGLGGVIAQAAPIAMGIAQAAVVLNQPNPYLQGGLVEERMRSGRTSPGEKLISVNENDKPEFIMNAATTARSLPLLNRMNRDPEYAAHINRQMQSRTPVAGSRQGVATSSTDSGSIGPIVAAAVREGMEAARVTSHINWSDFHADYERWKNNQGFIGN